VVRNIVSIIVIALACSSSPVVQAQKTSEEVKAEAMIQTLKERKDAEDKARLERAKDDITGISAARRTGSEAFGTFGWIVIISLVLAILKVVFFSKPRLIKNNLREYEELIRINEGDSDKVRAWKEEMAESYKTDREFVYSPRNELSYSELKEIFYDTLRDKREALRKLESEG